MNVSLPGAIGKRGWHRPGHLAPGRGKKPWLGGRISLLDLAQA
jgi:hypothetical protein